MKKSVDILGLPIISIKEGRELGVSKSLLMDAQNGMLAALIIEDEDWYRGVKVLPYASVIAIGDDAITITSSENILKLGEATEYEPLLTANIKIIGTKAITKSGTIQGTVTEIVIDDDGKVAKCEITTPENEAKEVAADQVSIFGKQVTIIDSETPVKKFDAASAAPKKIEQPAAPATTLETAPTPAAEPSQTPTPAPATTPEPEKPKEEVKSAAPAPKQPIDKAAEERHRRFLLGKKASRRITTDNGILIVDAGAEITEEVLQKAKLANKFVELSMNIQ